MIKDFSELVGQEFNCLTVINILPHVRRSPRECGGRCRWGKEFIIRIGNLKSGNTKSCGCIRGEKTRYDLTGQVYGRWTVISRVDDGERHSKWLCVCSCGTKKVVYQDNLIEGKSVSCGCYNAEQTAKINLIDRTGQKFGKLLVIKREPNATWGSSSRRVRWRVQCDCGKELILFSNDLAERTSCGCGIERKVKNLIGQKFGRLTIIELADHLDKTSAHWRCLCDCNNYTTVKAGNLVSGNTRSCGCLDDRVNTKPVSQQQRAIHKLMGGILNYKVNSFYVDIALFDRLDPIAIEYDSFYWHHNNPKIDKRKTGELIDRGWKVLRVKSVYKAPLKEQIESAIGKMEFSTLVYQELILPDWIKRQQEYEENINV